MVNDVIHLTRAYRFECVKTFYPSRVRAYWVAEYMVFLGFHVLYPSHARAYWSAECEVLSSSGLHFHCFSCA